MSAKLKRLRTPVQFCEEFPAFELRQVQGWIEARHTNGLAEAGGVLKAGAFNVIDPEAFLLWIETLTEQDNAAKHAAAVGTSERKKPAMQSRRLPPTYGAYLAQQKDRPEGRR